MKHSRLGIGGSYMRQVKAVLFDLDGTLYFKGKPIDGTIDTIAYLRNEGYQLRFMTNTDSRRADNLHKRILDIGISAELEEIHTPVVAAMEYLEKRDGKVFPLVHTEIEGCFQHRVSDQEQADYVVIGDFSDRVSYDIINRAFRHIDAGAEIVALKRGRFYYTKEGKNIDTGAFVALLEYATRKTVTIVGKPAKDFFFMTIEKMGLVPEEVVIVGDDITTDIMGAKAIGAKSILVKTGKFSEKICQEYSHIKPDDIIDSVKELPALLEKL